MSKQLYPLENSLLFYIMYLIYFSLVYFIIAKLRKNSKFLWGEGNFAGHFLSVLILLLVVLDTGWECLIRTWLIQSST